MIHPVAGKLRLVRARVADPERIARSVSTPQWGAGARVLKTAAGACVLAGRLDGRDVVAKVQRLAGSGALLRRLLGLTRAMRQWRGAELLASRGIATSEPLVLFRGRDRSGTVIETLLMELEPGEPLIELIARIGATTPPPVREQHELARAAGRLVATMCRSGLRNRDLKPSNLVALQTPVGWRLTQIDTVGVRDDADASDAPEMLFRLLVEPLGLGVAPRTALRRRVVAGLVEAIPRPRARVMAKEIWTKIEQIRLRHGDPVPRQNPIGDLPVRGSAPGACDGEASTGR